jgi:hypothetical protein
LVSCGVNDIKSGWFELTHEQLLARMRPVDDISGQIFVGDLSGAQNVVKEVALQDRGSVSIDPTAQTTLEKRRAALVKARAARAAKRMAANGTQGEPVTSGDVPLHGTKRPSIKRRKCRKRRTKEQMAAARLQALQDYEAKKSVASG